LAKGIPSAPGDTVVTGDSENPLRQVVRAKNRPIAAPGGNKMQQKDTAHPKTAEEIRAITREFDEAFNKHDATALVALYTEDSVQVEPQGVYYGRQAFLIRRTANRILK
jgi:hypothetical protein